MLIQQPQQFADWPVAPAAQIREKRDGQGMPLRIGAKGIHIFFLSLGLRVMMIEQLLAVVL